MNARITSKNVKAHPLRIAKLAVASAAALVAMTAMLAPDCNACTRFLYQTGYGSYIVGRSMDWGENPHSDLWVFPEGMKRDGGFGKGSVKWTSKYGSVVTSFYSVAVVDGMNEAGLVGNVLYLAESDFGDAEKSGKPTLSIGAWLQYVLDNYGSVSKAVDALKSEPFTVVAPMLPNGRRASGHLSLSDPSGDSAIFEYIDGKLQIHHSPVYKVMTNSPIYDKQLAINAYWDEVGGVAMLPGTYRAADRFVRTSFYLKTLPKFKDPQEATAAAFSVIRSVSVPIGIQDPKHPNLSTTVWRTVSDHKAKRYYFDSVYSPSVFWVDMDKLGLKEGAQPQRLDLSDTSSLAGEVSAIFKPAKPFPWLAH